MTATQPEVIYAGRNTDDTADRLEIRGRGWEATVWVADGMWPTVTLRTFIDFAGQEVPLSKERGQIRRAALKWAKENR
jgi:hypothetical protein